jgi:hypothetical protein
MIGRSVMDDRKGKQKPGDVILTPLPGGYLIQLLGQNEDGSTRATTIGNDVQLESAIKKARNKAAADSVIWLYDQQGTYRAVGPDEAN